MTSETIVRWAGVGLEYILAWALLTLVIGDASPVFWMPRWVALALPVGTLLYLVVRRLTPVARSAIHLSVPFLLARLPFWLTDPAADLAVSPLNLLPLSGPQIVALVAAYGLWWRGDALADTEPDLSSLMVRFELGIVALLGGLALLSSRAGFAPGDGVVMAIVFLLVGTLGLGAARRAEASGPSEPGADWLGVLLVVGAGLILAAMVLVVIVSPTLLLGLLDAVATLLRPLALALDYLLRLLIVGVTQLRMEMDRLREAGILPHIDIELPGWLLDAAGILGVAFLILGVIASLYRLWKALTARLGYETEDEEEGVDLVEQVEGGFRSDLRRLWTWLRRLFRKPRALRRFQLARSGHDRRDELLAGVRAIYDAYLHWAAQHGHPRDQAETPDEFLQRITRRFPAVQSDSGLLTEAYVLARYSNEPIPPPVVDEVRAAFQRLRAMPIALLAGNEQAVTEPA